MVNAANVKYDCDTKLLGLLGYPLAHSIASPIHNGLYRFGDINAVMLPMEQEDLPGNLDRFFEAVKTLRIQGFIVTMPYKTRMLPYMDEASEISRVFNCVNAVKYKNGKFYGEAFDGYGMCQTIEDAGYMLHGREALILGAGGISGVVASEMARRGVTAFTILNRTEKKAVQLARTLEEYTGKPVHAGPLTESELEHAAVRAGVVAQCTSAGMYRTGTQFPFLEFLSKLGKDAVVIDALYNPPKTAFLKAAEAAGLPALNGMGMLSNQAEALTQFFLDRSLGEAGKMEAVRLLAQIVERSMTRDAAGT